MEIYLKSLLSSTTNLCIFANRNNYSKKDQTIRTGLKMNLNS